MHQKRPGDVSALSEFVGYRIRPHERNYCTERIDQGLKITEENMLPLPQGLKITEENMLPLQWHLQMVRYSSLLG